uniref:Uncharacterized protein n=1 Tax=Arundo donax TaxID=35708 RepID=A0A0A9BTB6_ARUDO
MLSSTGTSSEFSLQESRFSDASLRIVPSALLVCSDEDGVESEGAGPSSKFKLAAKDLQRGRLPTSGFMGYAVVLNL